MAVEMQTEFIPAHRRAPAEINPPKNVDDFIERSNAYFTECAETTTRPTITGYALAVGLPGPTSLIRLGQRVPALRYVISRCMTAVACGYEDMIGYGNAAGPLFMLKNIPDFDPDEPDGAPPIQFFNDRKEVLLQTEVIGAAYSGEDAEGEDPVEAYVRLIRQAGRIPADATKHETSLLNPEGRDLSRPGPLRTRRALRILTEGFE